MLLSDFYVHGDLMFNRDKETCVLLLLKRNLRTNQVFSIVAVQFLSTFNQSPECEHRLVEQPTFIHQLCLRFVLTNFLNLSFFLLVRL